MLKVSVIILTIMLAYAGVYTLMAIFTPKVVAEGAFKAVTGENLDSIQNAEHLGFLMRSQRMTGQYALATVIASFFILFGGFQKLRRWAWWSFLIVGAVCWLWGVINALLIFDKVNLPLQAIGAVLWLLGVLLPAKLFFTEAAMETKAEEDTQEA
jgi:hypothetical protein